MELLLAFERLYVHFRNEFMVKPNKTRSCQLFNKLQGSASGLLSRIQNKKLKSIKNINITLWFVLFQVVRAASPVLLCFITLGAFLIYCTVCKRYFCGSDEDNFDLFCNGLELCSFFQMIVMYPRPNMYTCIARVWLREIGFSLTYGALMLKTWR